MKLNPNDVMAIGAALDKQLDKDVDNYYNDRRRAARQVEKERDDEVEEVKDAD